ncbi:MAG: YfiR family protein, partial [Steroidobacteraceae bacterium]
MQKYLRFPSQCRRRRPPWALRFVALRAAAWFLIGVHGLGVAQPMATNEYQLKAAFLFNFLQFVDWPASAFAGPETALSICVLGPDPFGADLDTIIAGEHIGGREVQVQRFAQIDSVDGCHLLFVNLRSQPQLRRALERLKGQPTLTVGDTTPFANLGGMIEFVTQDDRIRLRVNLRAAS